ncbi:MAG: hypothetical protein HGA65_07835, partial [Oscillochloris sp.]|nr:hypothetical protein [Oscillochloris sp.]
NRLWSGVAPSPVVSEGGEDLYPNGIDLSSGQPLLKINAGDVVAMARNKQLQPDQKSAKGTYQSKVTAFYQKNEFSPGDEPVPDAILSARGLIGDTRHMGVVSDVDQNNIVEARWAVVVRTQEQVEVLRALWPLIRHRMEQMGFEKLDVDDFRDGETCGAWLGRHTDNSQKTLKDHWLKIPPVLLVGPDECNDVNTWLSRRAKVTQAPVDPTRGVPFYLLIVGRPGPLDPSDDIFIPWSFQYELDLFWGVGRLIFSDEQGHHRFDAYRAYAEQVVAWETRPDAANCLAREIAFFGTRHDGDPSTTRSADELITPLVDWSQKPNTTPTKLGVGHQVYLGKDATRDNLGRLLTTATPPAVLFTATHGCGDLSLVDPARLLKYQGGLVTSDFTFGSIKRSHYLAGEDLSELSNLNVAGTFAFLFACYGAGSPQYDEFVFEPGKPRKQIAPFAFAAQLPQRLLEKGMLGIFGHVERAWTYSFSGVDGGADSQVQPFQDVIGRLLKGMPAGSATDQFNVIQGARSLTLTKALEEINDGLGVDPKRLSQLWMARNDARNYVLLGDPAAKLAM